jgi:DNA-binding beta-propeller fold protein YncE
MKDCHSCTQLPGRAQGLLMLALATLAGFSGCGRFGDQTAAPTAAVRASSAKTAPWATNVHGVDSVPPGAFVRRFVRAGTSVEMTLLPNDSSPDRPAGTLRAGDDVTFRFRLTDAATGAPISVAKPAAWLSPREENEPRDNGSLAKKIGALIQGNMIVPAELDLNQFYVLALNDDATITVVDPRFGFGGTKLLALVTLPGNGADWVLSPDGNRLFVSIPSADRVVVVDTASWTVSGAVSSLVRPTRLILQEDGHYLWTATETGVVAIDTERTTQSASIQTGDGAHQLALGRNDAVLYVSNPLSGTVSIIDGRRLVKVSDVATGGAPAAVAFSAASQSAYVLDETDGTISVLLGDPPALVRRIAVAAGAKTLDFAPGGRVAFVASPARHELAVIDAAADRIVRRVAADGEPDQVAFTSQMAYIRQAGSALVRLVPLDNLATNEGPAPVIDVPCGRNPLGRRGPDCLAPAIARASGEDAVLLTNPADQTLYYYKEGLSAPMGSFRNYGHEPCAVLAVDRSLRAVAPGVFQTVARLRRSGRFDVALFLDNPRLVHCFELEIEPDPRTPPSPPAIAVRSVNAEQPLVVGRVQGLAFRLEEQPSGSAVSGKSDVRVLATLPARWQQLVSATAVPGQHGTYAISFTPPHAGLYCFYVECPSASLSLRNPYPIYQQVEGQSK